MRQLSTVMTRKSTVRHLTRHIYDHEKGEHVLCRTLCGRGLWRSEGLVVLDGDRDSLAYALCKTCARARRADDADQIIPESNDAATRRAEAMGAPVRAIPAMVYRVQGSTDTYTVTVPLDEHLATICNCRAGKIHPELECKHAATVRMEI